MGSGIGRLRPFADGGGIQVQVSTLLAQAVEAIGASARYAALVARPGVGSGLHGRSRSGNTRLAFMTYRRVNRHRPAEMAGCSVLSTWMVTGAGWRRCMKKILV